MPLRIDIRESDELRAVVVALRAVDQTVAKRIRKETQTTVAAEWKDRLLRVAGSSLPKFV